MDNDPVDTAFSCLVLSMAFAVATCTVIGAGALILSAIFG